MANNSYKPKKNKFLKNILYYSAFLVSILILGVNCYIRFSIIYFDLYYYENLSNITEFYVYKIDIFCFVFQILYYIGLPLIILYIILYNNIRKPISEIDLMKKPFGNNQLYCPHKSVSSKLLEKDDVIDKNIDTIYRTRQYNKANIIEEEYTKYLIQKIKDLKIIYLTIIIFLILQIIYIITFIFYPFIYNNDIILEISVGFGWLVWFPNFILFIDIFFSPRYNFIGTYLDILYIFNISNLDHTNPRNYEIIITSFIKFNKNYKKFQIIYVSILYIPAFFLTLIWKAELFGLVFFDDIYVLFKIILINLIHLDFINIITKKLIKSFNKKHLQINYLINEVKKNNKEVKTFIIFTFIMCLFATPIYQLELFIAGIDYEFILYMISITTRILIINLLIFGLIIYFSKFSTGIRYLNSFTYKNKFQQK